MGAGVVRVVHHRRRAGARPARTLTRVFRRRSTGR
jgi:hypothetical protein